MDQLVNSTKKSYLIFGLIFFGISLKAQNKAHIMDSLRTAGNYRLELIYHLSAYKKNPTNSANIYNMACCYALLKNNDSAFYFLDKAIELGQDDGWALADCDLRTLHGDKRWKELENKLEKIYRQKNTAINANLGWEIANMYFTDQAPKNASHIIFLKYGMNSPQMDSVDRVIANTDSLNMLQLERIFNTYGWTGKHLVGEESANNAFIIILHAPLTYQKKYFDTIKMAVDKGDLSKNSLAYLTDKILTKEGKKQLYGTQLKYSHETKSYKFKPIEDEKNVNERRKLVGLGPIEDYAKNFGFEYKSN
jgi:tetratricopeptide (TPR) repeat protein